MVDHIDGLIEEWYPGLTTIDPMQGQDLMIKYVPCFMCTGMFVYRYVCVQVCHTVDFKGKGLMTNCVESVELSKISEISEFDCVERVKKIQSI